MENEFKFSPEEIEKALEKAKKEAQLLLDSMTPQEREQAEIKAKQLIEEDRASMQKLVDDAASLLNAGQEKTAVNFCSHCSAPANAGNFCQNCGKPLKNG